MKALDPGSLNRRILIEEQTTEQSDSGQQKDEWQSVRSCWAQIRTATSREVYAAAGFVSQLSHIVTVRYTKEPITSAMRVVYGDRVFLIQAVSDLDEGRVMQQLLCLEKDT